MVLFGVLESRLLGLGSRVGLERGKENNSDSLTNGKWKESVSRILLEHLFGWLGRLREQFLVLVSLRDPGKLFGTEVKNFTA